MNQVTVAIGAAEILGAVGLVSATFAIPAFADMALAWRVMAVFMILEGVNRVRTQFAEDDYEHS
jgi:hypothetical protein